MKVIRDLKAYRLKKKLVLTIGNFDGVHRGHQKILQRVLQDSKRLKASSAVLTFNVHPRKVIFKDRSLRLLSFLSHKLLNLESAGIEWCFLATFNEKTRNLSKETFLRKFIRPEKIKKVIVGYDFHFGKDRQGTIEDIRRYCRQNKILFTSVSAATFKKKTISSSRIRELVRVGKLQEVKGCFGRPYSVIGKVIKGSGIGRKIHVKTANVKVENEIFPPEGVYYVLARRLQKKCSGLFKAAKQNFMGLAYRGPLPDFNKRNNESILEVFLYRFKGNLYQSYLEVFFIEFIRKPKKVKNLNELEKLLKKDIELGIEKGVGIK